MKRETKLISGKYYILRGKDIVRILSTNQKENRVIIKICDSGTKEHMEYDTAHLYLKPIFKIGDAAKALQRSPDTLRKYERLGLIKKANKFLVSVDGNMIRFYTEEDLLELAVFFANQKSPGRPERTNSKINRRHLMDKLSSRTREWNIK